MFSYVYQNIVHNGCDLFAATYHFIFFSQKKFMQIYSFFEKNGLTGFQKVLLSETFLDYETIFL